MSSSKIAIAFIGTGVMGKSMAGHLLKAGHPLTIFTRTKEKASALLDQGAQWASSPAEASKSADAVLSIVGFPEDVRATYLGKHGVLEAVKPDSLVIDLTTSSPSLAVEIYEAAKKKKVSSLDAPVSGGDVGAREATLSIMVGGEEDAFNRAKPIFDLMGKNVVYHGKAGSGQHTKLSNQIAIAGSMIGMCESLFYAKKVGLDLERMLATIQKGAAGSWSLNSLAPRILKHDFNPGFMIEHFVKDMELIMSECKSRDLKLQGLELVHKMYRELINKGYGKNGTQTLIKQFDPSY